MDSETPPRVRRADSHEAREIADVWLRSRHASVPDIPPPVHSDDDARLYFATVVLPTLEVWVVEADSAIVALMVLRDDWIDHLYVDPDWIGCGLGSQLLTLAKTLRPSALHLWTFESNTRARRFYERHGFVAVDRTDGDNEEGAPDIRYRWTVE
jgi:GNAT superfamily N-acetyltransferase